MGWGLHDWWLKDSQTKVVAMGFVVPAVFAAWGVINVVTGTVYWPADHLRGNAADGFLFRFTDGWRVWGLALIRWGIAGGIFSWYALANFERTEQMAQIGVGIFVFVSAVGFLLCVVGFF